MALMASVKIENLTICSKDSKTGQDLYIVKGLCAEFESGKINAIMGPNGCGKTTTLTSLFGVSSNSTKTSGQILLDGVQRDPKTWFEKASLVEQLAYFPESETVEQALNFSLELKNSRCGTKNKINDYVEIVDNLHLTKLLGSKISSLSGGEKQRVMIAIELIADKEIIILDEPTSDLDAYLALKLICFLKQLAVEKSKMVIFTIHQPSEQIFKQFDNLLYICDGCTVYNGSADQLDIFLKSKNIIKPADWTTSDFLFEAFYNNSKFDVINQQKEQIANYINEVSERSDEIALASKVSNKSSKHVDYKLSFSQIGVLYKRSLRQAFSRKGYYFNVIICMFFIFLAPFLQRALFKESSKNAFLQISDNLFVTPGSPAEEIFGVEKSKLISAINNAESNETVFKAFSHVYIFLQNHFTTIITIGCNIFSLLMPSDCFSNLGLNEKEMLLTHYSPLSYIIASFLTEFTAYCFSGSLIFIGLVIVGAERNLYLLSLIRIVLSHIYFAFTIIFMSCLVFTTNFTANTKALIKSLALMMPVLFFGLFPVFIKEVKSFSELLALPLRIIFAVIDFLFPSILTYTYFNKIIQTKYSTEMVEILKNVTDIEAKKIIETASASFLNGFSAFGSLTAGIFPESIGILPILIASLIIVPVASFALFAFKFAPRVSLNP